MIRIQLATKMSHKYVLTTIALTILQARSIHSHNWMTIPLAYNTRFPTRDCAGNECNNACPPILNRADMANTPQNPAAEWRRGQRVRICYARNNHHGGIARFSLVPVNVMSSRRAHDVLTLFHTCWDAGMENCRLLKEPCGTDRSFAFCRSFVVPDVFPDGDYVLGHVWYGGLHFSRDRGHFPDFYSCSFVRVRGGVNRKCWPRFKKFFEPGTGRKVRWGKCHTSSTKVGECDRVGCKSKRSFYAVPDGFGPATSVEPIRCKVLDDAFKQKDSGDMNLLMGVCNYQVCCPERCGRCGGLRCERRPGGGANCCTNQIQSKSYRTCDKFPPPCIRT